MKSSSFPEKAGLARRIARDARRLAELDRSARNDLARAVWELGHARIALLAGDPTAWLSSRAGAKPTNETQAIDRVAFAIPRAAARVPWKATCLVQALAAQRWLAREGVASQSRRGARKTGDEELDAHAWLEAGGRVVVGGDPMGYQPFTPARRP
jgi:hypothetical protein